MKNSLPVLLGAALLVPGILAAGPAPANSKIVLADDFARAELGPGWHVNNGEWKIADGVLHIREQPADKHAASGRRTVETGNAVYELKFRLGENCRAFHFGFDPAKGQLQKKGHLFSVIITPDSWKIMKHVDKARRKEDPNETLATAKTAFETGKWYTLRVTTWGPAVKATIDGGAPLEATHPTFGVRKPTLVFRCVGDGVEVDDITVWAPRK
ncbi:MAG: hypothetical protein HKN82_11600 [Akkermansiaceae bacterium]|nr:hypothetical protein [Akkermansiaceae bacterium]NNM30427.1 hypothetical protein [Akkermansiaceae bacterium]